MYPYYHVTGNPLIDSLFSRPDQVASTDPYKKVILPIAIVGFIMAFIGVFSLPYH